MKTTRERSEEKRQEKLAEIRDQVKSGALVIRKMTEQELEKYPVRAAPPQRARWR